MEKPLDLLNQQIKQEKDRHSRVINELDKRKNQEKILHQQRMEQLNSRKEQVQKSAKQESCPYKKLNKQCITLRKFEEIVKKATNS